MSTISVNTFKVDNHRIQRVRMNLSRTSEKCVLQFKTDKNPLNVISTSLGIIKDNTVEMTNPSEFIQLYLELGSENKGECLLSFYNENTLSKSESLSFPIDLTSCVSPIKSDIQVIKTMGLDFTSRMLQFVDTLGRRPNSRWKVNITVEDDIVLKINNRSQYMCFASVGEMSDKILSSDIIFALYPKIHKLRIPKELIWKKFSSYNSNNIFCFELVKPDFQKIKNILYKSKISNSLDIHDIPKKVPQVLSDFHNPFGEKFTNEWTISKVSLLPVHKASISTKKQVG